MQCIKKEKKSNPIKIRVILQPEHTIYSRNLPNFRGGVRWPVLAMKKIIHPCGDFGRTKSVAVRASAWVSVRRESEKLPLPINEQLFRTRAVSGPWKGDRGPNSKVRSREKVVFFGPRRFRILFFFFEIIAPGTWSGNIF